jgi:hypothetical protein
MVTDVFDLMTLMYRPPSVAAVDHAGALREAAVHDEAHRAVGCLDREAVVEAVHDEVAVEVDGRRPGDRRASAAVVDPGVVRRAVALEVVGP